MGFKDAATRRAYDRKWREADPERVRQFSEYHRKWRKRNAKRLREYMRDWKAANPDYGRNWWKAHGNPVTNSAKARQWAKDNPQRRSAQKATRDARKRNAPGGGVSPMQWLAILAEHGGRCCYCARLLPLTMEHIDALAVGGAHDVTNTAAACQSCNSSKQDKPLLVWLIHQLRPRMVA